MKNYFFIAIASVLMAACNQERMIDKSNAELSKINHEKDSLQAIVTERDSTINDFMSSFIDVERTLDSVAVKQHIISMNAERRNELGLSQKERIKTEIAAINNLMDANRKRINSLNKKLKSSANKNKQFEKTIAMLTEQLDKKEIELADLNEKLISANIQVGKLRTSLDELSAENDKKEQHITEQTSALHTAYYVIGKSKDLQGSKIIDRKGGLLGIGKTAKLSANLDNNKFTRIDYTAMSKIEINGDGVKIITSHPTDSYTLEKDSGNKDLVKNIVITNPDKFWSASKYLVIVKS